MLDVVALITAPRNHAGLMLEALPVGGTHPDGSPCALSQQLEGEVNPIRHRSPPKNGD